MRLTKALSTAALIAGLGLSAPALAQEAQYDEAVLEAFVTAAIAITEVEQEYTAQLAEATSEAEQQELIAAANEQIIGAIESTPGVDVETYIEISEAAQADPDLSQRLIAMAQEQQEPN
jgi:hypothetical protein